MADITSYSTVIELDNLYNQWVLCQHFDGGQPQVSAGEHMQVSVLVDVVSLCWGRLTYQL